LSYSKKVPNPESIADASLISQNKFKVVNLSDFACGIPQAINFSLKMSLDFVKFHTKVKFLDFSFLTPET
jgi:hypothetical protein